MPHDDTIAALRFQRGAEHLFRLGPRALAEFLAQAGRQADCSTEILQLLAEYQQRLCPALIEAAGADRFPPRPLRRVG